MKLKRFRKTYGNRVRGCIMTRSRTPWCYGLCTPIHGRGHCGRLAPHGMLGRTQQAILNYKLRQLEEREFQDVEFRAE